MGRWFFRLGVTGLALAPAVFALTFIGVLPGIFGLAALLLVPVGGASVYIGVTADIPASETAPPLMQVFAGGGRC